MAKRGKRRLGALASSSQSLGGFAGLGEMLGGVAQDAMDLGVMGASALAGYYVGEQLVARVPVLKDQNNMIKGLVEVGLGMASGIAVKQTVKGQYADLARGVGAGLGAGLIASGGVRLLSKWLPAVPAAVAMTAAATGVRGIGATFVDDRETPELAGLGVVQTEEVPAALPYAFAGLGNVMSTEMASTLM